LQNEDDDDDEDNTDDDTSTSTEGDGSLRSTLSISSLEEPELEPIPPSKMNPNEIINYMNLYDDKKMSINEIDNIVINKLREQDPRIIIIFYKYHLDLIIRNELLFKDTFTDGDGSLRGSLDHDYLNYKNIYNQIKSFLNRINNPPETSSFMMSQKRPNKLMVSLDRFSKFPSKSIFNKINPETFAEKCHKMHIFYYFMMETRILQYISRYSNKESNSIYIEQFKALVNNFYRKMEYEIELYCSSNKFSSLNGIFKQLLETFLKLGNTTFAKWTISLINRYKICLSASDSSDDTLALRDLIKVDLKTINKYTYLVDQETLLRGFISSHEAPNKFKSFTSLFTKITDTKNEILKELMKKDDLEYTSVTDMQFYEYLNPNSIIKTQLYTGKGEIDCIKTCN
jgi:hypothetical protein